MEYDGYSIPASSDFFFDKHLKMSALSCFHWHCSERLYGWLCLLKIGTFFGCRPEEELVELLWQNGQVVMHNQTQRPPRKTPVRFYNGDGSAVLHHVLPDKSAAEDGDDGGGAEPSSAPGQLLHIQEDEMASWLQYPIDDSFDRDFCSDLFYPPAGSCPPAAWAAEASSSSPKPKVPPIPPPDADKFAANFVHFSLLTGKAPQAEPPRFSTSTATTAAAPPADREVGGGDPPVTSSSGGFGDWQSNDRKWKRKREGDELEGQKEVRLLNYI